MIALATVRGLSCAALILLAVVGCGNDASKPIALPPLKADGTPLAAGEYAAGTFQPRTTFRVDRGWATASPELPDYFDLVRGGDFEAISFVRVKRVAAREHPVANNYVSAPRRLVPWIATHPRLSAARPVKTEVGGSGATRIDATVKSVPGKHFPDSCDRACLPLFVPSDGPPVSYEKGDRLRFLVLDNGVTITVAASPKEFERFAPEAQKVISSLKFSKG